MENENLLKLIVELMGISGNQYRFDKASNFYSYEEYVKEKAIKFIISKGEEFERMERFNKCSDMELKDKVENGHANFTTMKDDLYYTYEGIDAEYELKRRGRLEILSRNN